MTPRVAVIRFPGSNCEMESLRALQRVGLDGEIRRWNEPPQRLSEFDGYLLPGGFSYQDRVRAGAVAARLPLMELISRRADEGAPVFGICNGAQILVEAGLVPGPSAAPASPANEDGERQPVRMALGPNRIPRRDGYFTRWVFLAPGPAAATCIFTHGLTESVPMPMAHGEGRYATTDPALAPDPDPVVALRYAGADGEVAVSFPWNPNGSAASAAGVCNSRGNVLALMPHPEWAQILAQVPGDLPGAWGERRRSSHGAEELDADGPGLILFRNMARHLREGGMR